MSQLGAPQPRRTGGGAATAAGIDFQNRVAAWLAVRVLAETEAQPLWGWPSNSSLAFIRCETEQPVDDVMVGNSNGDLAFIQVKRTISAGTAGDSPLASVFDQFVRQYLRPTGGDTSLRKWDRKFDANRDRLVLAVGRDSSGTIATDCREALGKLRQLPMGGFSDLAFNSAENAILSTIRSHMLAVWSKNGASPPSDYELLDLLRATYVEVIDVDVGGVGERESKELIRRSLVADPATSDLTWSQLLEVCAGYSRSRGGGGQREIRQTLSAGGVVLKAAPSYRADIERLRTYSQATIRRLAKYSEITVRRGSKVKIQRASTRALRDAVAKASILVIGEPGAGKSGALHDLAAELTVAGSPMLCLAADDVESSSTARLSTELGLEHQLGDVLASWGTAAQPVVFITDAIDAARTDHASEMFRDLIDAALEAGSNCRVVASIRMFDLRHDTRLRALFNGTPNADFRAEEFSTVSHFLVPVLNAGELKQLATQSADLDGLVRAVLGGDNADMQKLIAVPFNLRLLGEMVGEGVAIDSLTPIRTQIELLDRYWSARVIRGDALGDARETVLRKIAQSMYCSRRLHAPRSVVVAGVDESRILQDLLSESILQEYRPGSPNGLDHQTLKFPHHLLFDYAVARLLFRIEHEGVAKLIAADPDSVVAFRPSLVLHFRYLWSREPNHASFWSLLGLLNRDPAIPLIGKIIGPTVAADLFTSIVDFGFLFKGGAGALANEIDRRETVNTVAYLTGAQAARGGIRQNEGGIEAVRWAEFAVQLSRNIEVFVYSLRHVLSMLCVPADGIPAPAMQAIGEAGRCLLNYALNPELHYDGSFIRIAIEAVARSFSSDPAASSSALRRLLAPEHAARHGHTELFFLAQEVPRLILHDPSLVVEIYRVAFTAASDSDELTRFGTPSRILSLTSSVRQDWEGVHYALAEAFHEFIRRRPIDATRAAALAVTAYVEREHALKEPMAPVNFAFLRRPARIETDFSSIWDYEGSVGVRVSSAMNLLDAVCEQLDAVARDVSRSAELAALLECIVENTRHAVFWRRLLSTGAKHPEQLGRLLSPLAAEGAVLACWDLTEEIGDLLRSVFPLLGEAERTSIESALMALTDCASGKRESLESIRDRFLGCLPRGCVVTGAVRQRLSELDAGDGPPANLPHFRMLSMEESAVTDEEFLRHRGVAVDEPANKELLELLRPLKTIVDRNVPEVVSAESPEHRLKLLRQIRATLEDEKVTIASELREEALAYLAEGCARALMSTEGEAGIELKQFSRETLLEISGHAPDGTLETNEEFDRMPSWGSPNALLAVVKGLLLSKENATTEQRAKIDETIDRLTRCPLPEVRFLIAQYVGIYHSTNPARLWQILRHFANSDPSIGVLASVMSTISRTASAEGITVAEIIFQRSSEMADSQGPRESCLRYFLSLYVLGHSSEAWKHLRPVAAAPWIRQLDSEHIIAGLRDYLVFGAVEPVIDAETESRHRAQQLLHQILKAVASEISRIETESRNIPIENTPAETRNVVKALHRCIHSIGDIVYFASGALEERTGGSQKEKFSEARRRRFWEEMKPILSLLRASKVPSVSYRLVETLGSLIQFEPRAVFIEVSGAVGSCKSGGFQFESLMADLAVRIVREFIATHRTLLKDDAECRRALIEILDTFVEAGWPSALQLTFGLEEIYR